MSSKSVLEAIATRICLEADYNGTHFLLAPQILYTRHGEAYVDAVPIAKNGRPPREPRLSTFKLAGLRQVALNPAPIGERAFDPEDPRYAGVTLFSLVN